MLKLYYYYNRPWNKYEVSNYGYQNTFIDNKKDHTQHTLKTVQLENHCYEIDNQDAPTSLHDT